MAEEKAKLQPKHAGKKDLDPEALRRRERINLILMLVGAVLIVAGMFWVSQFLSGQN